MLRFFHSSCISLIASVTAVVIGISGAYALSKLRFKARSKINASFYTVYMFSGILIVVPLFKIISGLGLYDTNTALIITMVVQTLPTAIFMLKSYFDTIPTDIEEAAMIDGLSRIQIIIRISTPDYIWGRMMAASLVTALPVIIMYALSERFIKGDLVEGGVKG